MLLPNSITSQQDEVVARAAVATALRSRLAATRGVLNYTRLFSQKQPYDVEYFHETLAAKLDDFMKQVEHKQSPRLIVQCPPRVGKTELVSRCFPTYLLGRHPNWDIIAVTYSQDRANEVGQDVRKIVEDARYQELFPDSVPRKDANRIDGYRTAKGGSYRAVGAGGAITGSNANVILMDDMIKSEEEAESPTERKKMVGGYYTNIRSRCQGGTGIVFVTTRWHEDDLAGELIRKSKENPDADQWEVFTLPLFNEQGVTNYPMRHPQPDAIKIKASYAPRAFNAQWQQNPIPDTGAYFYKENFRTYTTTPPHSTVYLAADLAYRAKDDSDYTCVMPFSITAQDDLIFLPGIIRARVDTLKATDMILDLAQRYNAKQIVLGRDMIEGAAGPFMRKRMEERGVFLTMIPLSEAGDKRTKARSLQGRHEQQKVLFPEGEMYQNVILPEWLAFDNGKHDDTVDAAAKAATFLDKMQPPRVVKVDNGWKPPKRWGELLDRVNAGKPEPAVAPLFG